MPMSDKQRLAKLVSARQDFKSTKKGYDEKPLGPNWVAGMRDLDAVIADISADVSLRVPRLGKVTKQTKVKILLSQDLTHYTDGLGWPALDEMGKPGTPVIAPEDCIVYDNTSSAQGGDAFYIRGASGLKYWVAHIAAVPAQGRQFRKGQTMTTISRDHPRPHLHLAIDARELIGKHLVAHTNYTHGGPLIGVQLAAALEA